MTRTRPANLQPAGCRSRSGPPDSADADFIEDNEYFSKDVSASKYVPLFLAREYPALGKSSVANIGYDFYADYPEYLDELTGPDEYEVTDSNYLEVGAQQGQYKTFIGTDNPEQFIPDFLTAAIPGFTFARKPDCFPVSNAGRDFNLYFCVE